MRKLLTFLLGIGLLAALSAGGPLPATGQGAGGLFAIKQPDSLRFDVTGAMIFHFDPQNPITDTLPFHGSGAAAGPDSQLEIIYDDPSYPGKSSAITKDGKAYRKTDPASWTGPDDQQLVSVHTLLDIYSLPVSGSLAHTGFVDLELSRPVLHVTSEAPDQVNGVAATRYDVAVDLPKLSGASDAQTAAITDTYTLTLSLWVGNSDGYLRKLTFAEKTMMPFFNDTPSADNSGFPLELNYTMTFHDFNTPVTIVAPSAAMLNVPPPLPRSSFGAIYLGLADDYLRPVLPEILQTGAVASFAPAQWLGLTLGFLTLHNTLGR